MLLSNLRNISTHYCDRQAILQTEVNYSSQFKVNMCNIHVYTIIRVDSAFSLVASCVLLKYTRTDDVN